MQAAGPSGRSGKPGYFAQTPDGTRFSAQSFSDLNLSRPLVKACEALGYTDPTPIQVPLCPMPIHDQIHEVVLVSWLSFCHWEAARATLHVENRQVS